MIFRFDIKKCILFHFLSFSLSFFFSWLSQFSSLLCFVPQPSKKQEASADTLSLFLLLRLQSLQDPKGITTSNSYYFLNRVIMPAVSQFLSLMEKRHSVYALGKDLPLPVAEVVELIKKAVRMTPSPFHSQGARVMILFGDEHMKLWKDVVLGAIKNVTKDASAYKQSEDKVLGCFAAGAGTVLFFEDNATVEKLQKDFPSYAANFPTFALESSSMAQFAVWATLAEQKIGASLQHYNELIALEVAKTFHVDPKWRLTCQMPFGNIVKPAEVKSFIADEGRFIVKGA